jgi:hypothetical protein
MISDKRRREILSELREDGRRFAEAWRLASAYRKAGDKLMARYFMKSVKIKRRKHSPEEKAWVMEIAHKRFMELAAEAAERRRQGLPPIESEYKKPSIH